MLRSSRQMISPFTKDFVILMNSEWRCYSTIGVINAGILIFSSNDAVRVGPTLFTSRLETEISAAWNNAFSQQHYKIVGLYD